MCETNYLHTNLDSLQEENGAMRAQIRERQSLVASKNQVPGIVSVAQDTQIGQFTTNDAIIMGRGKSRRKKGSTNRVRSIPLVT